MSHYMLDKSISCDSPQLHLYNYHEPDIFGLACSGKHDEKRCRSHSVGCVPVETQAGGRDDASINSEEASTLRDVSDHFGDSSLENVNVLLNPGAAKDLSYPSNILIHCTSPEDLDLLQYNGGAPQNNKSTKQQRLYLKRRRRYSLQDYLYWGDSNAANQSLKSEVNNSNLLSEDKIGTPEENCSITTVNIKKLLEKRSSSLKEMSSVETENIDIDLLEETEGNNNNSTSVNKTKTSSHASRQQYKKNILQVASSGGAGGTGPPGCGGGTKPCPSHEELNSLTCTLPPPHIIEQKYEVIHEGDMYVLSVDREKTRVINKFLSIDYFRRWEKHHVILTDSCITAHCLSGCLKEKMIKYSSIDEVDIVDRLEGVHGYKFFIHLVIPKNSLIFQIKNAYSRDQWYTSILFKKKAYSVIQSIDACSDPGEILKLLKSLILSTNRLPLLDSNAAQLLANIATFVIQKKTTITHKEVWLREFIIIISPILDNHSPNYELCRFFSNYCLKYPASSVIWEHLTRVICRILKFNGDFSRTAHERQLVCDYVAAISKNVQLRSCLLHSFVLKAHGLNMECPHPRVLPNLVATCIARINSVPQPTEGYIPYITILRRVSEYDDWMPILADMLHPVPFKLEPLNDATFLSQMSPVIFKIGTHRRCSIHSTVLPIRPERTCWFDIYCDGFSKCRCRVWSSMLGNLLNCCCKNKAFLSRLIDKQLNMCYLLALLGEANVQCALCSMLELNLIQETPTQKYIVFLLQTNHRGKSMYLELVQKMRHLQHFQQKEGPLRLCFKQCSDEDLRQIFSIGSFGNLESLDLGFTHVTSSCADVIIKFPSLKYLNLWSTQFGDIGLRKISEHLTQLEVLNLCETPITDSGIVALCALKSLRVLNLNSTKLTEDMLETLKKQLPNLENCDVRYTDGW
uniref:C-Maf-inducing protein n=1 Tax=Cacopsylla melanoneura TaxID=428564 RepID=A0A8D8SWA0_9HEMI